jgi:hypothetical protein
VVPRFFEDFPDGGLLGCLPLVGFALGQRPIVVCRPVSDQDLEVPLGCLA